MLLHSSRPLPSTRIARHTVVFALWAPRVLALGHLTLPGLGQGSDPADGWRYESSTDPADVPGKTAAQRTDPKVVAHLPCQARKRARRSDQPVLIFKTDRAAALPNASRWQNPGKHRAMWPRTRCTSTGRKMAPTQEMPSTAPTWILDT